MSEPLADYLLDNYGECRRGNPHCGHHGCRKTGWRGRLCPHWSPLGATTWDELKARATLARALGEHNGSEER